MQAHVAEFRLPETEIAETKSEVAVRVQLRQEPGGVAVGGKELDDGFEVDGVLLLIEGGALGAAVLEEFLALGVGDECHRFDSCLGGPRRSGLFRLHRFYTGDMGQAVSTGQRNTSANLSLGGACNGRTLLDSFGHATCGTVAKI